MKVADVKKKLSLDIIDPENVRLMEVLASANCEVRRGIYKDKQVVVKILKSNHRLMRSSMVCEAGIWSSINGHPNVVRLIGVSKSVFDMNAPYSECFLVSEYMESGSLDSYMKHQSAIGSKEMLHLLIEAAKGLEYMHSMGIIHRDVKLDNILVNSKLEVKIVDFGFSERLGERVGGLVYTPLYAAPEVNHGLYGTYSDVYSFGVCLDRMFHQAAKGKQWMSKEMQSRYKTLKNRCMENDTAKRPTMAQVLQSLIEIKADKSKNTNSNKTVGHGVFLRWLGCHEFKTESVTAPVSRRLKLGK